MPAIPPRHPPASRWPLQIGPAAGLGAQDFYALGMSSEYDEAYGNTNPDTFDSPTSRFTHVLHYVSGQITSVYRITDWLTDLWWSPAAAKGLAVGFPRSIFEFDAQAIREHMLNGHDGSFFSIWGLDETDVYACGYKPFAMHRHAGVWHPIALPRSCHPQLHDVWAFSPQEVYFVGGEGTVLHYDGSRCIALEVPTTRYLYAVAPLDAERLCIGGASGLLMMGNRHGLRVVPSGTDDNIEILAHLGGKVYYVSEQALHAFDGSATPITVLQQPFDAVYSLGDALLLQEGTDAWLYDGQQLTPLPTTI
ncbi:MAG: hypothetical protein Tsb007_00510 [Rhizobacter sp.]